MRIIRPLLIALVVASMAGVASGEKVYKWTDEQGTVHFTTTPPPTGQQFKEYDTSTYQAPVVPAPTPTTGGAGEAGAAAEGQPSELSQTFAANCDLARNNEQTLLKTGGTVSVSNSDGTTRDLSEAEREAQLAAAREQISLYCKEG